MSGPVPAGSGDLVVATWLEVVDALDRLSLNWEDRRRVMELVTAHGGACMLEGRAQEREDVDAGAFARVCAVVERMWRHWPLDEGGVGPLHTSGDARAAARRIFAILGKAGDASPEPAARAKPTTVAELTPADFGDLIRVEGWETGWLCVIEDRFNDGYPDRSLIIVRDDGSGEPVEKRFADSDPSRYPKTMGTPVEVLDEEAAADADR